jgi:hypothetical protein
MSPSILHHPSWHRSSTAGATKEEKQIRKNQRKMKEREMATGQEREKSQKRTKE